MLALMRDPLVQSTGLLESFLEGVINAHTDDEKDEFLSAVKRLPTNIYATKYNELWEPSAANEESISQPILRQLNDLFAKYCDEPSDEDDSDERSTQKRVSASRNCTGKTDNSSADEEVNDTMKTLNLNVSK